ncbi:isocitrate lyase/PEP mutase family protein [Streptodolium elevatio]|uniref:Isocitrate lyase/phosphoenolpyruvate mutase family protein n=1 Tax=Streptodolium elevatio TaxID=3157996 RepID=A0ABV3DM32_9ACTN
MPTPETTERGDRYEAFRALHRGSRPLLLPNAWDHASASALVARGFTAIATTSLGVASALGKPDGQGGGMRDDTVALARRITRLAALVTVDAEGGFSDDPDEVAALAAELAAAGVVGMNLEDGRSDGTLADLGFQRAAISAVKAAVPDMFVNARTDAFWLGTPDGKPLDETLRRCAAYVEAGADGVFVPGLEDDAVISAVVGEVAAPVNVLFNPARHTYGRLADLGVARISCGSLLFRTALHSAVELAWSIAEDTYDAGRAAAGVPSYAETQALADPFTGPTAD